MKTVRIHKRDSCGDCSMCCKLLQIEAVPDIEPPFKYKPWNKWCESCKPGASPGGCQRYNTRPEACKIFECIWLQSQYRTDVIPLDSKFKPNRSHVVLVQSQEDYNVMFAYVDPAYPDSYKREPMRSYLISVSNLGATVIIVVNDQRGVMTKGRATVWLTEGQIAEIKEGVYAKLGPSNSIEIGLQEQEQEQQQQPFDASILHRSPTKLAAKDKFNTILDSFKSSTAASHEGKYVPRRIPRSERGYE